MSLINFFESFINDLPTQSELIRGTIYSFTGGGLLALLIHFPKIILSTKTLYKYLSKSLQDKADVTTELRNELIECISSDNNAKVSFYFYENRIRSKCSLFMLLALISIFAMLVFTVPMLSMDFRTSIESENINFIVLLIVSSYALTVISAFSAVHYKLYLIRINSIFNELIRKNIVFDPHKYINL